MTTLSVRVGLMAACCLLLTTAPSWAQIEAVFNVPVVITEGVRRGAHASARWRLSVPEVTVVTGTGCRVPGGFSHDGPARRTRGR